MFIGSAVGSYLPVLWGGSLFSFTSIILSAVGGIIGIVAGIMIGSSLND
jgi:hypothetical protein